MFLLWGWFVFHVASVKGDDYHRSLPFIAVLGDYGSCGTSVHWLRSKDMGLCTVSYDFQEIRYLVCAFIFVQCFIYRLLLLYFF